MSNQHNTSWYTQESYGQWFFKQVEREKEIQIERKKEQREGRKKGGMIGRHEEWKKGEIKNGRKER